MRHDLLSDVFYVLNNAEQFGKRNCTIPASRMTKNVLLVMQKSGYIGNFEFIDDGRQGQFKVELIGKINKSRSIRPRFAVKKDGYGKFESRYLPGKKVGILIISTPKGVMSQQEAEQQDLGGRVLGYVY